jgi:REP element-mobilizing transposase RayT
VRRDIPSLRSHKIVRAIEAAFRRGCERAGFRLVHYSLQDDHVHLIVEADGVAAPGRGIPARRVAEARAHRPERDPGPGAGLEALRALRIPAGPPP